MKTYTKKYVHVLCMLFNYFLSHKTDKKGITKFINIVPKYLFFQCLISRSGLTCSPPIWLMLQQERRYRTGLYRKVTLAVRHIFRGVVDVRSTLTTDEQVGPGECEVGEEGASPWQASCLQVHPWLAQTERAPPLWWWAEASQVDPPQVSRWGDSVALRTQLLCSLQKKVPLLSHKYFTSFSCLTKS